MSNSKDTSYEYNLTPSHALPAFRGGIVRGYVCPKCGHLEVEESKLFGLTCPICFQEWASTNIPQMITVKEAVEKDKEKDFALEPTKKYDAQSHEFKVATTVRIRKPTVINNETNNSRKLVQGVEETKPKPKQELSSKPETDENFPTKIKKNYFKSIIYYIIGIF